MCELTTGFYLDCKTSVGGVKAIWLGTWADNIDATFNVDGEITALTGVTTVYKYDLPPQTADFKDAVSYNKEAGTYFYTQTCNVMLHKLSVAKRKELANVIPARLVLFVLDANDNLWLCDYSRPVDVTSFEASSGKALGDANGYSITFTCEAPNAAYKCTVTDPTDLI